MKRMYKKVFTTALALLLALASALPCFATSKNINGGEYIDVEQFKGKRIGVVTGTIYNELVPQYIEDVEIKYFKSNADMVAALSSGKVDAIASDEPVIRYLISSVENGECGKLETGVDYIAVLAGNNNRGRQLIEEFNIFLKKIENNGELESIQNKWFGGSEDDRTMDEYEDLPAANGSVIIATDPSFPPMEYVKDNKIIGYDIDLIVGFCKEYGYKPNIVNADFAGILAGIQSGKYDIGASGFSITEERKKVAVFSEPVYESCGAIGYINDEKAVSAFSISNIKEAFKKTFIDQNRWELFVDGIRVTLMITILSIIFGTILGFIMHMLCRKGNKYANAFSRFANWLVKGLPEVVLLMILFYVVFGSVDVSGELVAIIGFTLTFACSMHAMLSSSEKNLDIGQFRAATALGYSERKAFFRIILPQTARMFMPNYLAEVSSHIKATAVVGYIAVIDVTRVGDIIRGSTYEAFFPLIAVAILYFILAGLLCWIIKLITRKLDPTKRSEAEILKGVVLR